MSSLALICVLKQDVFSQSFLELSGFVKLSSSVLCKWFHEAEAGYILFAFWSNSECKSVHCWKVLQKSDGSKHYCKLQKYLINCEQYFYGIQKYEIRVEFFM